MLVHVTRSHSHILEPFINALTGRVLRLATMGGYKQFPGGHVGETGPQNAMADGSSHQNAVPFTYRLNMSALDWAKVRRQKRD